MSDWRQEVMDGQVERAPSAPPALTTSARAALARAWLRQRGMPVEGAQMGGGPMEDEQFAGLYDGGMTGAPRAPRMAPPAPPPVDEVPPPPPPLQMPQNRPMIARLLTARRAGRRPVHARMSATGQTTATGEVP